MMRVGTFIGQPTNPEDIKNKLRLLQEYGLDNCQFSSWGPSIQTPENAAEIRRIFSESHVDITALWCGWEGPAVWNFYEGYHTLGLVPEEYREKRVQNLLHGSEFCGQLGVNCMVSHMGFLPENPNDPEYEKMVVTLRRIAQPMKERGQYLLFETGQETPVVLMRIFEDIGTGNLGVNLDTANLILYGKANPVDALDMIGKYVMGVHAKDGTYPANGRELGHETAIGQGKVDFPALIRGLHKLGYDGSLTIEREISGDQQKKDILDSVTYLRNIINSL